MIKKHQITGVLLAGGRGTRMGHVNKGLQLFQEKPMALHVLDRLLPQVNQILINANENIIEYAQFGMVVCPDVTTGFLGPLAGIEAGLKQCQTPFLLSAPCDCPFIPDNLASLLSEGLFSADADIAIAKTQEEAQGKVYFQRHPVFSLMRTELIDDLSIFIANGGRKVDEWLNQRKTVEVLFTDNTRFLNFNTLQDLQRFSS